MSLYVLPENQELLWNVISKNIYIQDFFAPYNPEKKNEWFKAIIRTFYERYKLQKLTVADLNSVNKETITYMIQNVREQINQPVAKTNAPTQATPSYQPANSYSIPTPPIVPDTRVDIYAKEFEQRQQEYANLNKKTVPANVNFTEKADDGVIQNMDELIKLQMQQRAYEMSMIPPPTNKVSQLAPAPAPLASQSPPPTQQPLVNAFLQNNVQSAPPKLQIDATSNIEISIEEIGSPSNKKNVRWKTDEQNMNSVDSEILILRESVNNMTQEFAQLKQLFELSQTSIADLKEANAGLAMKYNDSIERSNSNIAELKEANSGLAMKLNQLVEWSQINITQLNEANNGMAMKLNNSIEWSHISIVHLNEANTGLAMKYNELLANQVAIQQVHVPEQPPVQVHVPAQEQPSVQVPEQPTVQAAIPSPDEIKSTMERILTQMDNE